MMKSIFLSFMVIATLLGSRPASAAANICYFAFNKEADVNYSFNLEVGKVFKFHLRDRNQLLVGTLLSTSQESGKSLYTFKVEGKTLTFFAGEILSVREVEKGTPLIKRIVTSPIEHFALAKKLSQLMFKPFKTLAPRTKRLEIVGNWTASKATGLNLSKELTAFDSHMEGFGFQIPAMTRIVISDRPILPDLIGPFSLSAPTVNVWRGLKPKPSISMSPLLLNAGSAISRSVLFHERMHSVLHASFVANSFINENHALQEALADYGAALYAGSPEIGPEVGDQPVRNIHSRHAEYNDKRDSRTSVLDAEASSDHENSMLISNVFWELSQVIGAKQAQAQFYPLLEALNTHRASFEAYLQNSDLGSRQALTTFSQDLNYILAVTLKSTEQISDLSLRTKARESILKSADRIHYTRDLVIMYATHLQTSSPEEFKPNKLVALIQGILVTAYGATGLAIDGAFTYWVTNIGIGIFN